MALATFAAAGFGNVLFHYLSAGNSMSLLMCEGPLAALWSMRVYMLYGSILSAAITVSHLRTKKREERGIAARFHPLSMLVIVGFYCLIGIVDDPIRTLTLGDYAHFVLTLVGLGPER
jgi:hypothetical protein